MCDEETDHYFIQSDVFKKSDQEQSDDRLCQSSIDFLVMPKKTSTIDEDGDWDLGRPEKIHLSLVHRNITNLEDCGQQLWNGALLLCDYLLTHKEQFVQRTILELGAGIGLCSLLASRYAARIICTDRDESLLKLIRENIEFNTDNCRPDLIKVQTLDWKSYQSNSIEDPIEIVLAADVIYDDDLTDLFFDVIMRLFDDQIHLQSIYVTIEKRLNFYLETRSVQAPAYDYFLEKLQTLKMKRPKMILEQISTDISSIPQCVSIYQRTDQLVLWRIADPERISSSSSSSLS